MSRFESYEGKAGTKVELTFRSVTSPPVSCKVGAGAELTSDRLQNIHLNHTPNWYIGKRYMVGHIKSSIGPVFKSIHVPLQGDCREREAYSLSMHEAAGPSPA